MSASTFWDSGSHYPPRRGKKRPLEDVAAMSISREAARHAIHAGGTSRRGGLALIEESRTLFRWESRGGTVRAKANDPQGLRRVYGAKRDAFSKVKKTSFFLRPKSVDA